MNKDKLNCSLILILFILYYCQSLFFSEGVTGPSIAIIIAVISVFYLFKIINKGMKMNSFAKLWLLFILYQTVIYLLSGNYSRSFGIFQRMLLNTLPFFPFYYFINKGILTRKHFNYFLVSALPLFILNFYKSFYTLQDYRNSESVIVTAAIYMFIGLIPFVFMIRNKLFAALSLLTIWSFFILSNKKSAVFCGIIAIILFAWQNLILIKKFNLKNIIFSIALLIGLIFYSYKAYNQNEYLQKRILFLFESGDSVRENIVERTFDAWYNSDNIITYLFGLGYDSSRDITGISSHNDIVDAITSFGLFGFLIYFLIFFYLIKLTLKKDWDTNKRVIMFVFLGIALITSLSNRWYTNAFPFMITVFLPYLLLTRKKPIW